MGEGLFIVLEGIDGSGKSSLAASMADRLSPRREVILTAEPSDGWVGDAVRRASAEEGAPLLEALLFVADRAHHTERVSRWLAEGKTVICDRYYASTLAYQSAALGDGMMGWLRELNDKVVIRPDLTLLLDIDPAVGMDRVNGRGAASKFEELEYLKRVRDAYLRVAEEDGFKLIDASLPEEEALAQAMKAVEGVTEMI